LAPLQKKRLKCKPGRNSSPASCSGKQAELHARCLDAADFEQIRHEIMNLVCNRALEAVDQMIEHVQAGNFQAMKYLFEIVGLFPVPTSEAARPDDSLARKLLSYLEAPEGGAANNEVSSLTPSGKIDSNTVK
jgi:hypothetical protein